MPRLRTPPYQRTKPSWWRQKAWPRHCVTSPNDILLFKPYVCVGEGGEGHSWDHLHAGVNQPEILLQELNPCSLEARHLLRPYYRSPGRIHRLISAPCRRLLERSHQYSRTHIGVLVPGLSCAVGEGHEIDLASRLSDSSVFPSSDISPRRSWHHLRLPAKCEG